MPDRPDPMELLKAILRYENPLPGQTPLRRPKNWPYKTVHGVELDEAARLKAPPDRRNFFWVKPKWVLPVVQHQWNMYVVRPRRYGLPPNPALEQAAKVWDKSHPERLIRYLQQRFGEDIAKRRLAELLAPKPQPKGETRNGSTQSRVSGPGNRQPAVPARRRPAQSGPLGRSGVQGR